MLEALKGFFIVPFISDNFNIFEIVISIFGWLLVLFIIYKITIIINNIFHTEKEKCHGIIISKNFTDKYSILEYNVALNIPMVKHYDSTWSVTIEIESKDNMTDTVSVSEKTYNEYKVGDSVEVLCSSGRLWKSLIINELY